MLRNNNSQSHPSLIKSSDLNSYNLYMSSNKYYMNLFETSFKNYKNNLIVDAGNEMDPNDMHKLPNIYDEWVCLVFFSLSLSVLLWTGQTITPFLIIRFV